MKNKNKKKECKNCNHNNVIEKKINTMENGKEYFKAIEKEALNKETEE